MTRNGAAVSGVAERATQYRTEVLARFLRDVEPDLGELPDGSPKESLKLFFRLYGFNRPGGMRAGYQNYAASALERVAVRPEIEADSLWDEFVAECETNDTAPYERMNRGVVKDTARLVNREGNLFRWVGREDRDHGRLSEPYDELQSIDGIGPKIARFFLRDAVCFCGVEDDVRPDDRQLLQSLTGPVRLVAESLWPILADTDERRQVERIVTACSDHDVSGVEFNQGAWYLAREEADGDPEVVDDVIEQMRRNVSDFDPS